MSQYTSYYLYEKYEQRSGGEPVPCYPNEFSIDGDGTQAIHIKKENDEECGYDPPVEPIYRWYQLPIATDYVCAECPSRKFLATYNDSRTYALECDGDTTLTSENTTPSGYRRFNMVSAVIGDCVTEIGENAFNSSESLTSVTIPNSVTSIGYAAFSSSSGLTSVTIPSSVTNIGTFAFDYCTSLTSVTIPSSVTSMGGYAFANCTSLESINIENGVTFISDLAFQNCTSLESVTIPSSVTSIGKYAFTHCSALTSVTVLATTPPTLGIYAFNDTNDCPIYVPSQSLEAYETAWSTYADRIMCYDCESQYRWEKAATTDYICVGVDKHYKEYYQVSYDGGETWKNVKPEQTRTSSDVIEYNSEDCGYVPPIPPIPTGTKLLTKYSGGQTYELECGSSSILSSSNTRPSGYQYSAMTIAVIGDCVTRIDYNAFANCSSLNTVAIGSSVRIINNTAFQSCRSLTSVTIPDTVTWIGDSAFEYCTSLTSINIPNSVTSLGDYVFYDCSSLTSCTIGSGVTSISRYTFQNCSSLSSVTIGNSVTSISKCAFRGCSGLTSVTIPNSVTSIGENAFQNCTSLASINIPASVESIGGFAFGYCTSLTSITVNATTPPTLSSDAFYNTNDCPIYVPSQSVNAYKSNDEWMDYADRIQAIP